MGSLYKHIPISNYVVCSGFWGNERDCGVFLLTHDVKHALQWSRRNKILAWITTSIPAMTSTFWVASFFFFKWQRTCLNQFSWVKQREKSVFTLFQPAEQQSTAIGGARGNQHVTHVSHWSLLHFLWHLIAYWLL